MSTRTIDDELTGSAGDDEQSVAYRTLLPFPREVLACSERPVLRCLKKSKEPINSTESNLKKPNNVARFTYRLCQHSPHKKRHPNNVWRVESILSFIWLLICDLYINKSPSGNVSRTEIISKLTQESQLRPGWSETQMYRVQAQPVVRGYKWSSFARTERTTYPEQL